MTSFFNRNSKKAIDISKHSKANHNQNDMISDAHDVYIKNNGKFEQITGAVVDVQTSQDLDQIYVDFNRSQDGKTVQLKRASFPKGVTSMELKGNELHLYKPDAKGEPIDIENSPVTLPAGGGGGLKPFSFDIQSGQGGDAVILGTVSGYAVVNDTTVEGNATSSFDLLPVQWRFITADIAEDVEVLANNSVALVNVVVDGAPDDNVSYMIQMTGINISNTDADSGNVIVDPCSCTGQYQKSGIQESGFLVFYMTGNMKIQAGVAGTIRAIS